MNITSHMAVLKKIDNNKCWWGCEILEPLYTADGKVKYIILEKNTRVPQKDKVIIWPRKSSLDIYLNETKHNPR